MLLSPTAQIVVPEKHAIRQKEMHREKRVKKQERRKGKAEGEELWDHQEGTEGDSPQSAWQRAAGHPHTA